MESRNPNEPLEWPYVQTDTATFEHHKTGLRILYRTANGEPPPVGARKDTRLRDQSSPSRHRAAYAFGQAECSWYCMTLLTWRTIPVAGEVKRALHRFTYRYQQRWGEGLCGWILEMQDRGAPHYHLFHARESAFGFACANCVDHGRTSSRDDGRTVVRGGPDWWVQRAWLDSIRASDADSVWFNQRGIVELFESSDAAGRYCAKEAAKREQKVLPAHYQGGLGRWWYLSPRWNPLCRLRGQMSLELWPWKHPVKHIWNAEDVAMCIETAEHTEKVIDARTGMLREVPPPPVLRCAHCGTQLVFRQEAWICPAVDCLDFNRTEHPHGWRTE